MIGKQIGPYRVLERVGAGGMGEVYRARDARLNRDVAIKVLPEAFASDAERRARFEREAQAVAALNHPNIAQIYGLESTPGVASPGGSFALVMELLEGETLRERLLSGALPVKKAVEIAVQLARGLSAAHDKHVVHRDLKPDNVFLLRDGQVKILDFGLAKNTEAPTSATETVSAVTDPGTVMGTVGYMAPEQVRGQTVDARADLFALGAVLYEMVSGQRAFTRDTAADTMTAILTQDPPDLTASRPDVPPALDRIIRHCLEKHANERFQNARDIAFALEAFSGSSSSSGAALAPGPSEKRLTPRVAALALLTVVLIAAAVVLAGLHLRSDARREADASRPIHLQFEPPDGERLIDRSVDFGLRRSFAIAPDGATIVYIDSDGGLRSRALDVSESRQIPGTAGANFPFFSPDGRWIAFVAAGELRKVALSGGAPVKLCPSPMFRGGAWSDDGWIYFVPNAYTPISRIRADGGGTPEAVTRIRTQDGEQQHRWPEVLPGGQTLLYVAGTGGEWDEATIIAERLDTGARKVVLKGGTCPRYLPTGHLVFGRAGALYAVAFNMQTLATEGPPAEVARGVLIDSTGIAHMDVSRSGTLLTSPTDNPRVLLTLAWVDRAGKREPLPLAPQPYESIAISPDGGRAAVTLGNVVAIADLGRSTIRKLTLPGRAKNAVWSRDGRRVFFGLEKGTHYQIYSKAEDDSGAEQLTRASGTLEEPISVSADGTRILSYRLPPDGQNELVLWSLDARGTVVEPTQILKSAAFEGVASWSPDERWVAYQSRETGQSQIFVRPASGEDRKWQASFDGGWFPIWSRDGREIFFLVGRKLMAVPVQAIGGDIRLGAPKMLFENHSISTYDAAQDGRRFLVSEAPESGASAHLDVVVNWFAEVRRKMRDAKAP